MQFYQILEQSENIYVFLYNSELSLMYFHGLMIVINKQLTRNVSNITLRLGRTKTSLQSQKHIWLFGDQSSWLDYYGQANIDIISPAALTRVNLEFKMKCRCLKHLIVYPCGAFHGDIKYIHLRIIWFE